MKIKSNKVRASIGAVLMIATFGACTSQAPVDKVGLKYTGGPLQGIHFKKLIKAGTGATFLGWEDSVKWLPAGQRNYIVSKNANEGDRKGSDFIQVPALGGVLMDFEISTYFKLNTSCVDSQDSNNCIVRKFWENIGNKYHADGNAGWDKMLDQNFRKNIESAMQEEVRQYDAGQLYANQQGSGTIAKNDNDILLAVQGKIASTLTDRINANLGGSYFCGPTFDRNKGSVCPPMSFIINSAVPHDPATIGSFESIRRSANDVLTAQNNAQVAAQNAAGVKASQDAQGQISQNFIDYTRAQAEKACAEKQQGCTLVVVQGSGSNVNVNTGGK
jgi:hypothetical protein